jgi:hypothetical protein
MLLDKTVSEEEALDVSKETLVVKEVSEEVALDVSK